MEDFPRLKGVLKMLGCAEDLPSFHFNLQQLQDTQKVLERRRKKGRKELLGAADSPSEMLSFKELVARNRFTCFFIVQGSKHFYSEHTLNLRKKLAMDYNDSMTTFFISVSDNESSGTFFCEGTGFAIFPSSEILLTLLNVTQVPTIVIVDSTTGRPLSSDAALAIEWNDAHYVINAWQRKDSGLSIAQKALSLVTCQSACTIL